MSADTNPGRDFTKVGDHCLRCNQECPVGHLNDSGSQYYLMHPVVGVKATSETFGDLAPICKAPDSPPQKLNGIDFAYYKTTGNVPNTNNGASQRRVCTIKAEKLGITIEEI